MVKVAQAAKPAKIPQTSHPSWRTWLVFNDLEHAKCGGFGEGGESKKQHSRRYSGKAERVSSRDRPDRARRTGQTGSGRFLPLPPAPPFARVCNLFEFMPVFQKLHIHKPLKIIIAIVPAAIGGVPCVLAGFGSRAMPHRKCLYEK
jgi:hypothetical protein